MMPLKPPYGSIRQRESGRWEFRHRVNGRGMSDTFNTFDEAFEEGVRLDALSAEGRRALALGKTVPIEKVALYWAHERGFAEGSRLRNESNLRRHILPTFGGRPLAEISRFEVKAWATALPLKPKSAKRVLDTLGGICQFGLDHDWIERDPTSGVRIQGASQRRTLYLPSIDQIEDLRDVIDRRYGPLIDVMAYGGCGPSEAAGLRVGDLDFDRRVLHVHATRKQVADGPAVISETMKTATRDRQVTVIPERVWHRLDAIDRDNPEGLVAPAPQGGVLHPGNFRNRVFGPAAREVFGEGHKTIPYDLRHFAISLWLTAGMNQTEVAEWAGHASTEMVSRIYGHALPRTDSDLEKSTLREVEAARIFPRAGRCIDDQALGLAS